MAEVWPWSHLRRLAQPIKHEPVERCEDQTCLGCRGGWATRRGDQSVATEPRERPWWKP